MMQQRIQNLQELLGKTVCVSVDRPIGYRHGDILYPINYGYIPGLMAADGEEQDAYILGPEQPISTFEGQVIAVIHRQNDVEDKLVVAPTGTQLHQGQIAQAVHFQEQHFDTQIFCLFEKSCGVLAWRINGGMKEYLLVLEQYSQCWSLPKGHMDPGETETETALRELWEETGLTASLDTTQWAQITYPISPVAHKQVIIFSGEVTGTIHLREGEISQFRWVRSEELADYLFPDTVEACKPLLK